MPRNRRSLRSRIDRQGVRMLGSGAHLPPADPMRRMHVETNAEQPAPTTVRIMLATNDHRNGEPTGHIEALEIEDVITLDAPEPAPPCVVYLDGATAYMEIAGKTYPILRYASWVGNWVWDAVTVSADDAVDILDRLRKTERWSIEEAEHTVYGKWKRGEKILSSDLREHDE